MTRLCTCCRAPLLIAECLRHRAMTYDFIHSIIAECPHCMSTQCWVLWELSDEQLAELAREEAA